MAKRKKISRKELLKKPDEFITTTGKLIGWITRHQKSLLIGLAGVFLAASGYIVFQYINARAEQNAFRALHRLQMTLAAHADSDAQNTYALVSNGFEQLITDYRGREAAKIGRLVYANLCLDAGKVETALAQYKGAKAAFDKRPIYRNLLQISLGHAYEKMADTKKALSHFENIANGESPLLKDVALYHLGRLYAQMGEVPKSEAVFNELIASYPDFMYNELVRETMAQ